MSSAFVASGNCINWRMVAFWLSKEFIVAAARDDSMPNSSCGRALSQICENRRNIGPTHLRQRSNGKSASVTSYVMRQTIFQRFQCFMR
ncbi:MAG: hypothetical protein NT138_08450, partial [Planctomycetales bacterium]|nr:hypothetical protein [Planctomycetales bacterium]